MADVKMTISQKLDVIATEIGSLEFEDGTTVAEFCEDRKAKLVKKASGSSKKSKENKEMADKVLEYLTEQTKPVTLKNIQTNVEGCSDYSTSKMSAIVKILVDNGSVTKEIIKKVRYYSVATETTDEE